MNGYRTPNKHEAAYYKRKAVQKILNSLIHIFEGVFIYESNLSNFQNLLLDKSNGRLREKSLKHKAF